MINLHMPKSVLPVRWPWLS